MQIGNILHKWPGNNWTWYLLKLVKNKGNIYWIFSFQESDNTKLKIITAYEENQKELEVTCQPNHVSYKANLNNEQQP